MNNFRILEKEFYLRPVLSVAKNLLGKIFVKKTGDEILSGIIVEVEAYDGSIDEAAHTFTGKTKRNQVMFEEGGLLYVYFTYGMHYCCNVVTGGKDAGCAILLRGIEPVEGVQKMSINRFGKTELNDSEITNLTNGPAKICKAFEITRKDNGSDLTHGNIFLLDNKKISGSSIVVSKRIGIKKSVDLPWRFYIKDNRFVSKK